MLKFKKKTEEKKSNELLELERLKDEILKEEDPERAQMLTEKFMLLAKLIVANGEIKLLRQEKEALFDKEILVALIAAGTNIMGILLILNYEKLSIITSKSLGFVAKLRL